AGRAADERAGCGEATDCSYDAVRPIAIAGAEAAIDPKIEAGPVVDGGRQRGRKTWRLQIGRECLSGGSDDDSRCGNKHPPHATLPYATSDAASDTVFGYCAVTPLTLSPRTMRQLRRIEGLLKSAFDPIRAFINGCADPAARALRDSLRN